MAVEPFEIAGVTIEPGKRRVVSLPLSFLSDHTQMNLTLQVLHGKKPGPVGFVSAAIHGDEIIGVEIIRRLSEVKSLNKLRGTLILAPVVNAYGFIGLSRYLPDRRDLNRCFPGNETGSLGAQLANVFMTEIVQRCSFGLDLHSGAVHRENLPQIRANLDDDGVEEMANAFGASIMLNANLRDGSLRQAAQEVGCNILVYEAGEALRFDETAIRIGVKGVLAVLQNMDMLPPTKARKKIEPIRATSSHWLRAPIGGVIRMRKPLGARVNKGDVIGTVSDPLDRVSEDLMARNSGIIIGRTNLPVVNLGDAIFHVARVPNLGEAEEALTAKENEMEVDPLFDGIEIY